MSARQQDFSADPFRVEQQRAVGRMHLQWQMDRLRLALGPRHGGFEFVERSEEPPRRRLRSTDPVEPKPDPTRRFVPLFDGTGVIIRGAR